MIRFGAMGRRIFSLVFAIVLLTGAILGTVTLWTLSETATQHGQSQLETMARQLKLGMEQEYQQLLQLSQQMMPLGPVGQIMDEYLRAQGAYELGEIKRRLSRTMAAYSGLRTQLVMYYDVDTRKSLFSTFLEDDTFRDGTDREVIYEHGQLRYEALHRAHSKLSNKMVVSLSRSVLIDERTCGIYVEFTSDAPGTIRAARQAQGIDYVLVQLDPAGVVRYSSDEALFPKLSTMELGSASFGLTDDHYYVRSPFTFGSSCVVLAPEAAFFGATRSWVRRIVIAGWVLALLVTLAAFMLYRYVFRGLGVFKREMDMTIAGDLTSSPEMTGIGELDQLLRHFDAMKQNIQRIMREDQMRTEALHRREREMLIYQINPHFLFNTLNSLHWLATMANQPQISRYASNLNQILRYNLGRGNMPPTLRTELKMLDLYLEIELARHDFQVVHEIEEGPHLDMEAPRLILQPIVENAIGHGMDEGGTLRISVRRTGGGVEIAIADDGVGISDAALARIHDEESAVDGHGVGLRYVRAVLRAKFGDEATLVIARRDQGGTRAVIWLPYPCGESAPEHSVTQNL